MQKYSFRMEQVLKLRESREEQAAREQASALEHHEFAIKNYRDALSRLDHARSASNSADPFDLFNQLAYCAVMATEVEQRKTVLQGAKQKLDSSRRKLVKAVQETTIMEKLKEKDYALYQFKLNIEQQRETDEIANRRYVYSKR